MNLQTNFVIPGPEADEHYRVGGREVRAVVEGWGENTVEGFLLDFQSGQGIKVLPDGHAKALALRFNQIKRLRLYIGTRDRPQPSAAITKGQAGNLHSFAIKLRDGAIYAGLCYGYRKADDGLWIFPRVGSADDAQRVFIPRSGMINYQLQQDGENGLADSDFGATVWQDEESTSVQELSLTAPSTVVTQEQLRDALRRQATLKPVPIGEALLGLGKVSSDQLAVALQRQKTTGTPLGQTLIEMGLITPADLQVALARKMGYPFVDVAQYPVDAQALRMVPMALAQRLHVLPLTVLDGGLVVAMPDPFQYKSIEQLEFTTQAKVIPVVSTESDLVRHIGEIYSRFGLAAPEQTGTGIEGGVGQPGASSIPAQALNASSLAERLVDESLAKQAEGEGESDTISIAALADNTLVRLVNTMIAEAFHQGASDIHIEPYPGNENVQIRFRVDGHLRTYLQLPAAYRSALVARIKIMCDLDIAERRKPQDGKINFKRFGGLPLELRVATIPTVNGMEDVVLRLLSSSEPLPLDKLHLSPFNYERLLHILERPYGLFLCVGPTGSGKTTTLHAALRHINTPDRKIWTAEDPVEITQRGLRQIQVNPKIGWTFAHALRALLRADPDVIMVGEIRDSETAEMAIEASLTGHFVLSTLHTNSAPETITRLHELGVDPFSFGDSLQGILAQRLVRKVCASCVRYEPIEEPVLTELTQEYQTHLPLDHPWRQANSLVEMWLQAHGRDGRLWLPQPQGCSECGHTGYRGRLAIHELLCNHPDIHPLIVRREAPAVLRDQAVRNGMRTLRQDGIEKVLMGLTTLAEVRASSNL
ncbi:MAG: GspE/PulE family protein [Tepidimonas sp.]|uniref:GspE/PulE family protein n=1 Tax=Tepidimonas sp. TaxID=2002775 RepID=UPI00298F0638|nr:GspE/PulE family protein [Tepidimonas sp.]MCS6811116.1 GspE/PulE family protein [Tepidimonas sp.]MDW8335380.1 GspE/PulE family protein [Tepidimonas sp.]